MRHVYCCLIAGIIFAFNSAAMAGLPSDVRNMLDGYNVTWTSPSTNGSIGSMPIGNGDITLNVWVENGGDLLFYLTNSNAWAESFRNIKIGRIRVKLTPNPFAAGNAFVQSLRLHEGEIVVTAGQPGQKDSIRIWVDANNPVIYVEAQGQQPFSIQAKNEIWRTTTLPAAGDRAIQRENPVESADRIATTSGNEVMWYHRNSTSPYYNLTFSIQHVLDLASKYPDPYLNRTFGAGMIGTGMVKSDSVTLSSSQAGTSFRLSVFPLTAQTSTAQEWQALVDANIASIGAQNLETARTQHRVWWDDFWNRSWIFITGDNDAINVTRGYLLQRWMMGCQGRGKFPVPFNGGNFTMDMTVDRNADFHNWGPGTWFQNMRLLYWPMLQAGDFDCMQPFFNAYKSHLALQKDVTLKYYGHGGAFFPETMNCFGLYTEEDWSYYGGSTATEPGNDYMKYYWQGGIELTSMMLNYYDYTQDNMFAANTLIPIAQEVVRFYDLHWSRVNGKLRFNPIHSLETYQEDCTNPAPDVAGLHDVLPRLIALPVSLTPDSMRARWQTMLNDLPPIPIVSGNIVPAEIIPGGGGPSNSENPELYPVFPYRIFGLGKPGMDTALSTFNSRLERRQICWSSQDNIQAAYLGQTSSAKSGIVESFTQNTEARFPGFWNANSDWIPDLDNGGGSSTALQVMLLQNSGSKMNLFPSWPSNWNVSFKLCAPMNTTVQGTVTGTRATVAVTPSARRADLTVAAGYSLDATPIVRMVAQKGAQLRIGAATIESPGQGTYRIDISTIAGRTIRSMSGSGAAVCRFDLRPGIYFATVKRNGNIISQRFEVK